MRTLAIVNPPYYKAGALRAGLSAASHIYSSTDPLYTGDAQRGGASCLRSRRLFYFRSFRISEVVMYTHKVSTLQPAALFVLS